MSEGKAKVLDCWGAILCGLLFGPRRARSLRCCPSELIVRGSRNGAASVQGPRVRSWPRVQITGASDTTCGDARRHGSESRRLAERRSQESERGSVEGTTAGQQLSQRFCRAQQYGAYRRRATMNGRAACLSPAKQAMACARLSTFPQTLADYYR